MKISGKFLIVNGTKVAIKVSAGPWIEGVNPNLIKIRPSKAISFPESFRQALSIENNSDSIEDYFESDCIRLYPGHALYASAKSLAS